MSIKFCDGFDHYIEILDKWDTCFNAGGIANTISSTLGRFGGGGLKLGNWGYPYISKNITPATTGYFGFALDVEAVGGTYRSIFRLYDNTSDKRPLIVDILNTGKVKLSNSDGTVYVTSTASVTFLAYSYLEIKFILHDSTGVAECKLNGTVIATFTGDTKPGTCVAFDGIEFGGASVNTTDIAYIDDFYYDDSGYLGDVMVQPIYPTDAGTFTDWSPSAIPNWAQVDDNPPDGDSSFVYSRTISQTDTYTFSKIDANAGTVYAVVANIDCQKVDPGDRTLQPVVYSGTLSGTGPSITVLSSYKILQSVMDQNPVTATTWSVTDVNTYEFGQAVIT